MGRFHTSKRLCTVCKIEKDEQEFQRKAKFKFTGRCFSCSGGSRYKALYHYDRDKEKRAIRLTKRLEIITAAKAIPCSDCGQSFPEECMDFDHIGEKSYTIADMKSHSVEKLLLEISKCEVVCANCHRIRTKNRGYRENKVRFTERNHASLV